MAELRDLTGQGKVTNPSRDDLEATEVEGVETGAANQFGKRRLFISSFDTYYTLR
jgi:hypothetical protein